MLPVALLNGLIDWDSLYDAMMKGMDITAKRRQDLRAQVVELAGCCCDRQCKVPRPKTRSTL